MVRVEGQERAGSQGEGREKGGGSPKWQEVMENFETLHSFSFNWEEGNRKKGDTKKRNVCVYSDTKVFDL